MSYRSAAVVLLALAGCTPSPPSRPPADATPVATATPAADAVPPSYRRVVTGLDASGRSAIAEDRVIDSPGIWFGALPIDVAGADPLRGPPLGSDDGLTPKLPRAGFAAGILRWPPGGPPFPMHASPTFDIGVVLSGAVELQLESGSTVLRPGDVVVQRGTLHTWKVVGDAPCVLFALLLDATGKAAADQPAK